MHTVHTVHIVHSSKHSWTIKDVFSIFKHCLFLFCNYPLVSQYWIFRIEHRVPSLVWGIFLGIYLAWGFFLNSVVCVWRVSGGNPCHLALIYVCLWCHDVHPALYYYPATYPGHDRQVSEGLPDLCPVCV